MIIGIVIGAVGTLTFLGGLIAWIGKEPPEMPTLHGERRRYGS